MLTVITSGTAPSRSLDWISAVETVQLSIDSLSNTVNDRLRGRRGALSEALDFAAQVGKHYTSKLRIAATATTLNAAVLPDAVADWVQLAAVKSVVVQPLIGLGRGARVASLALSAAETLALENKLAEISSSCSKPVTYLADPLSQLKVNRQQKAPLVQFHIEANGDVTPHPLELAVLGNVAGSEMLEHVILRSRGYWTQHRSELDVSHDDGEGRTSPSAAQTLLAGAQPLRIHPQAIYRDGSIHFDGHTYDLNQTAQTIVGVLSERSASVAELVTYVTEEYDCADEEARADVHEFLSLLLSEGIVLALGEDGRA